jgi:putative N6-adenine-specific DNA methylase
VRLGTLEARDFSRLRRGAAHLPWQRFAGAGTPLEFHVSQTRCRLYHTGAVEENLALALRDASGAGGAGAQGPALSIYARGERDRWTLSVDSSGELLHRRGWRRDITSAPLRETLAAGLLLLCKWDPETPLLDPMCGAGTIALEACALAMQMAPGIAREFAFTRFGGWDAVLWNRLLAEARAQVRSPPAPIVASDRDAKAVRAALENAARGGFGSAIEVAQKELADAMPPPGRPGLVLINPPYGRRLGDPRALRRLCMEIGRWLRARCAGWRAGVLLPGRGMEQSFGLPLRGSHDLRNGGLRVRLLQFEVPGGAHARKASVPADRKRSQS